MHEMRLLILPGPPKCEDKYENQRHQPSVEWRDSRGHQVKIVIKINLRKQHAFN